MFFLMNLPLVVVGAVGALDRRKIRLKMSQNTIEKKHTYQFQIV